MKNPEEYRDALHRIERHIDELDKSKEERIKQIQNIHPTVVNAPEHVMREPIIVPLPPLVIEPSHDNNSWEYFRDSVLNRVLAFYRGMGKHEIAWCIFFAFVLTLTDFVANVIPLGYIGLNNFVCFMFVTIIKLAITIVFYRLAVRAYRFYKFGDDETQARRLLLFGFILYIVVNVIYVFISEEISALNLSVIAVALYILARE